MAFEFLSKLDRKDSDQGLLFYRFESQIGNKEYDKSVISTCFPLFMQLNEKDFSDLQRNNYINNVLSLDDFIKECKREKREESGLDSNLSNEILDQNLEDEFSFECPNDNDLYNNNLKFQIKMISVPIEDPLKEYGVKNIGTSDIFVEGKYNKHFFRNVRVGDGFFRKENIFGMDFIQSFNELTFGNYNDCESVFGFIE